MVLQNKICTFMLNFTSADKQNSIIDNPQIKASLLLVLLLVICFLNQFNKLVIIVDVL